MSLHRFAGKQRDKADQLRKEEERSFARTLNALLGRAQKAEKLALEIEAKLEKLHDLKDEGEA